ncbi:hypothetical protein [Streptomyces sp. TR06-5]|uniref:hypothetical protein n=1 Tax=unclassified Streptomyces TaxID=2593676 RepID=UPI0039A04F32
MHERDQRRTRAADGMRAASALVLLTTALAACGGGSGERPAPRETRQSGPSQQTVALVERTNRAMSRTSFTASGTNSAFGGAQQEITWDPAQGFHMTVRADDGTETDVYCRDGRTYISAPLLAETLSRPEQPITVPDDFADRYVTVEADSCDGYFTVPTTVERAPRRDTVIDGSTSRAVTVEKGGSVDVYHLAADAPRLMKWDVRRDGVQTTMTYGGYGKEYPLTLPPEEQRMEMSRFQAEVLADATGG